MDIKFLTYVEDIVGDILRLQTTFKSHSKNIEDKEIVYWNMRLDENVQYNLETRKFNEKTYINIDFIRDGYYKMKNNLYYDTVISKEPKDHSIVFILKEKSYLRKKLNLDNSNYYVCFSPNYQISHEYASELKNKVQAAKKIEKIYNYFYKILLESNNKKKIKMSKGILNNKSLYLSVVNIVNCKEDLENGIKHGSYGVVLAIVNFMKNKGVGIKTLSILLNNINQDSFPIYSHDLYKYLRHNKLLEEVDLNINVQDKKEKSIIKDIEVYISYSTYLSQVITECCKFKSGFMMNEDEEFNNYISDINYSINYEFSFLDLL